MELICEQGFDRSYGARPLRRALTLIVEHPLIESLLSGEFEHGDTAVIDLDESGNPVVANKSQPNYSEVSGGVYIKPNEAYTLVHNHNDPKILRITQATLGDAIRTSPARSTVNCSIGDKPEIAICSLIVPHLTCCQLDLEFHESHDVIFSVKGPRGIHLAGYLVTPAADHLHVRNDGNEVLNGDEVPETTECGLLQENGTLRSNNFELNSSTDALERSEDKVKAKRKASTIEPTASGYVGATEDDKFGSESRIIKENGLSFSLQERINQKLFTCCFVAAVNLLLFFHDCPSLTHVVNSHLWLSSTYLKYQLPGAPFKVYTFIMKDKSILIRVSRTFKLEKAVCNHGFFMMAPNRWNPSSKTLVRPLRLPDQKSVTVSINLLYATFLYITVHDYVHHEISASDHQAISDQVTRMLKLSTEEEEHVKRFQRLHSDAAETGFGHLFRNPTLFEDIVKSILLCGCRFKDTLEMAENLCTLTKRKLSVKRKRGKKPESSLGNFPSPQELAGLELKDLDKCCLGYRGATILKLAKDVSNGEINLLDLENLSDADKLYSKLKNIEGIGDFVANNVLMCMGFYHKVPVDSETIRHIKQVHQRPECSKKNVEAIVKEIYDKLELVKYYEENVGKLYLLKECDYKSVAGSFLNKRG
ncbi:DNA glycosylase [Artemisia annua]|uniref:DNA glycosylase n=1 Tax=Artemisia annua TaxID=35608 RepID=A0A2U1NJ99_ARTAN|nr:DNA glycosylase [Artemisia annua]